MAEKTETKSSKRAAGSVGGIFVGLTVIGILLYVVFSSFVIVEYGTVGVVTRFGRVTERVMQPGLNFKIPIAERVVKYRTQKIIYETLDEGGTSNADYQDYPVGTTTSDGQQVSVRYTLRFSVDGGEVAFVANNLGTEWEVVEKVVKADSRVHVRGVIRGYTAGDLYSGNVEQVQQDIFDKLEPIFEDNGLILDSFGIRGIEFSPDYVEAIEAKQIEKEKVKTEEFRAQQEEFRKQALITQAQGEAEAQKLQQQTLTPILIQKMWIEKWDGDLPNVVTGSEDVILDLNQASSGSK